jgi:hypothetical protein
VSPHQADSASLMSLTGQNVTIYFTGAVHAPTPVGSEVDVANAVYGNSVRGKLLTSSDAWIELEMTVDHRRVAIPVRSVGYVITDIAAATRP